MFHLPLKHDWQKEFFQYLIQRGTKEHWLKEYRRTIYRLGRYLEKKKINDISKVNKEVLLEYQEHLYKAYQNREATMRCKVITIRVLFQYLYHKGLITHNPAYKLEALPPPKEEKRRRYYNWEELKSKWVNNMHIRGYSWGGIKQKVFSLEQFVGYMKGRGIKTIYKIIFQHIKDYELYLKNYLLPTGTNYSEFHVLLKLRHMDQFFRYMHYRALISDIPTENTDFTRYKELIEEHRIKKEKKPLIEKQEPSTEPTKLELLTEKYISWRLAQGYRYDCRQELRKFLRRLVMRGVPDFSLVTKQDILDYQNYLAQQKTREGKPYKINTIRDYLVTVWCLFRFLTNYEFIQKNPCATLEPLKKEQGLPRVLMTQAEVQKILNAPDILTPVGIRDKAIMEVLYSTGMRANELANLTLGDIDFGSGTVKIMQPKGGVSFQRVVPIGLIACEWIKRYVSESRPLINKQNKSYLFFTTGGNQIDSSTLGQILKEYIFRVGLRKNITSHSFRVTCATHMLKNDADIRYVQEQLGHHSITSTQLYTRLIPKDLKRIHEKCHPREREAKGLPPLVTMHKKSLPEENKNDILTPSS